VKNPAALSRAGVKRPDVAGRLLFDAVAAASAGDHQVLVEDHGAAVPERQLRPVRIEVLLQVERAFVGEAGNQLAGCSVQAIQHVANRREDAAVLGVLRVLPESDAAIDAGRAPAAGAAGRVELPEELARRRVERANLHLHGGDVHDAIDHDRRALDGRGRTFEGVPGVMDPGHLKAPDVGAIDLVERRVAAGPRIAAVMLPLAGGSLVLGCGPRHGPGRGQRHCALPQKGPPVGAARSHEDQV
jgi:hypothetical protein